MGETPTIRLRTLGSIALVGADRDACARVIEQPKQLALLVFLAARPGGEGVSRDRILATLWPNSSSTRARGSLRASLHRLRRALGAEMIVNQGVAVAISPRHLRCDAALLLETDSQDSPESLLDLYRGEFLDALHLRDAPDFERWVDRTRAVLRARITEIAWHLAARAEAAGEWISAASYARRAADLAVDIEGATQRLIALLDRAGDRAAAVAEYERLSRVLQREYDLSPSPATTAHIERIRDRGERSGPAVTRAGAEPRRARSIAVLPFEDLSGGAYGYLASGISEDLLASLWKIHDVRVISRASVRRFGESPPDSIRAVREALGVDLAVEGSVQVAGDRCRITVQLIDAQRDAHLWASTYDRAMTDVFEVQSDVVLQVVRALEAELSPREHERLRRPTTTSFRAWQLYLKGREAASRRTADSTSHAASLFERALELDDRFAAAWVGLADARLLDIVFGRALPREAIRAAKHAITRAVECDPESGEAHATMGLILTFYEPDPPAAETEYRRAVEYSPGYATGHQWYGNWLCAFGRGEEGLAELRVAAELDPLSPVVSDSVALALLHLDRTDIAQLRFRETLEMDPGFWRAWFGLAVCHAVRGDLCAAAAGLLQVWEAGGWGADPRAAREARALLDGECRATLEHLLKCARSLRKAGETCLHEIVLLMMLDRAGEALAVMESGHDDPCLPVLLMYAPLLDPLAERARFRKAMTLAGIMLPRWRSAG